MGLPERFGKFGQEPYSLEWTDLHTGQTLPPVAVKS